MSQKRKKQNMKGLIETLKDPKQTAALALEYVQLFGAIREALKGHPVFEAMDQAKPTQPPKK